MFIQTLKCTIYKGSDEHTRPEAWIYPTDNPSFVITITYSDIIDCKKTEIILKPYCTKFTPRKYGELTPKSMAVSDDLLRELDKIKEDFQSYEMVIWELLILCYTRL